MEAPPLEPESSTEGQRRGAGLFRAGLRMGETGRREPTPPLYAVAVCSLPWHITEQFPLNVPVLTYSSLLLLVEGAAYSVLKLISRDAF